MTKAKKKDGFGNGVGGIGSRFGTGAVNTVVPVRVGDGTPPGPPPVSADAIDRGLHDPHLVGSHNSIYHADGTVSSSELGGGGGGTGNPLAGATTAVEKITSLTGGTSDLTGIDVATAVQGAKKTYRTNRPSTQ